MESPSTIAWYLFGTFFATLLGAFPPLLWRWSSRQLHLFVAFGAGVFLGAVFLHILPEISSDGFSLQTSIFTLLGFLMILLVERVLMAQHEAACEGKCPHEHEVLGWTTFVGLTLHSIAEGLGLGFGLRYPRLGLVVFIAIIAHKTVAAFSLATVFQLAGFERRRSLMFLLLFALSTPIAALAVLAGLPPLSASATTIPAALAAGTFLYVATCDLLPEAFHDNSNRKTSFIALLLGIAVLFGVERLG